MTTRQQPLAGPVDFRGSLIEPGARGYDQARALYNAMIDKRPALIARCADVADVIATADVAAPADVAGNAGMPLGICGGGHNGAGLGSVDDGIVCDLSPMRGIRFD